MLTKWIPTEAKVLALLQEQRNRNVSPLHVDRLAAGMVMEGWNPEISPILFYPDGSLADGQHRLQAWLKAGCPKMHFMAATISKDDIVKVDAGRPRSTFDHAKILGLGFTNRALAAAKVCLSLRCSSLDTMRNRATHSQAIEAAIEYETNAWARAKIPAIVSGVCAFVAKEVCVHKARLFMDQIEHGERLTKTDPAYHVRSMLLISHCGTGHGRTTVLVKTILAWNAFHDVREMKVLRAPEMPYTWIPIRGIQ